MVVGWCCLIAFRLANRCILADPKPSDPELKCLHYLYTSDYESNWRRNPPRVEGTLQWFLDHAQYQHWRHEQESSLLWVSADPGCGKSVLASFLVDELKSPTSQSELHGTVCYFFFKDDNEKQNNATFALCALLHQLFTANNSLLKYAMTEFKKKDQKFTEEFGSLWYIFMSALADPNCGKVICVVDGLDECGKSTQQQFIESLVTFSSMLRKEKISSLKFIVTSRPYPSIERQFKQSQTIRLKAEDKTDDINSDISLVVRARVGSIASQRSLTPAVQAKLEERLIRDADRTFLWVSLILKMIEDSARVSEMALEDMIGSIPSALDEVYQKILQKCSDHEHARKLLHIVVAAIRPLTLDEINVALSIRPSDRSHDQLDLEPSIDTTVKDLCGLFVRVKDSMVFLVHQTAKQFLVNNLGDGLGQGVWKNSLLPMDSNLTIALVCIRYLLFAVFETEPLVLRANERTYDMKSQVDSYTKNHVFLDYAAKYWTTHIQEAKIGKELEVFDSALEVLDSGSMRLLTWFQVNWIADNIYYKLPQNVTGLMVASYFGLSAAVERLIEKGADVNVRGDLHGSALNAAAFRKHRSVVITLLKAGAIVYLFGNEYKNILQVSGYCWHSIK
ncbi:hypothetical protein BDD12DRAFT_940699 [Trichophaea hybrida]|nr:hypothetical protein BDD12DRAFT_940699 [Trichophaea hybrida]